MKELSVFVPLAHNGFLPNAVVCSLYHRLCCFCPVGGMGVVRAAEGPAVQIRQPLCQPIIG